MNSKTIPAAILALTVVACGGETEGDAADAAAAVDTTVTQIEREPLTDADLVGLDLANLSVELPWTSNRINRNPAENAARAMLETVEANSYETFDRVVLGFRDDAPFPGYSIDVIDAGTAVACGASEDDHVGAEIAGDFAMVLRMTPARVEEDGQSTVPLETEEYGMTRLQEAGPLCDENESVTWLSGISNASQIRVLEFRAPTRLVVDVR